MDFRTKPISRLNIRRIAVVVRKLFKCRNKYYFDVVKAFERLPHLFDNVVTEIVEDDDPVLSNVPSAIIPDMEGNYCIKIKQTVYDGAYFEKNGGYRMHIMHEISHFILFMLGFLPCFDRAYQNNALASYESIEWQAKALAGEILIPFDATIDMSSAEIMQRCKVSEEAANIRKKIN